MNSVRDARVAMASALKLMKADCKYATLLQWQSYFVRASDAYKANPASARIVHRCNAYLGSKTLWFTCRKS